MKGFTQHVRAHGVRPKSRREWTPSARTGMILAVLLVAAAAATCYVYDWSDDASPALRDDNSADDDSTGGDDDASPADDDDADDDDDNDYTGATDGFRWVLYGDLGNNVSGTAYVYAYKDYLDKAFEDSYVVFDAPDYTLEPSTCYDFILTVYNMAVGGPPRDDWIYKVALFMPNEDYVVDIENLSWPDPLHGEDIDRWMPSYYSDNNSITWETIPISAEGDLGDIRAGEYLDFTFRAITDSPK